MAITDLSFIKDNEEHIIQLPNGMTGRDGFTKQRKFPFGKVETVFHLDHLRHCAWVKVR
jgi:hypothetical protein